MIECWTRLAYDAGPPRGRLARLAIGTAIPREVGSCVTGMAKVKKGRTVRIKESEKYIMSDWKRSSRLKRE